ncbi:hypothetical protein [Streptomyces sp. NPDC058964]|uniref:hypothetical protein n=1 Tax=Streptomyces sp. NPDC058964 TaxID=3346681 RepID=UPI0036B21F43
MVPGPLRAAVLAAFTGTFAFAHPLLRKIGADSVPDPGGTLTGVAAGSTTRSAAPWALTGDRQGIGGGRRPKAVPPE